MITLILAAITFFAGFALGIFLYVLGDEAKKQKEASELEGWPYEK
jgi:hypothetical protein